METESLNKYIKIFKNLRISRSHGNAPHKPILLLSIIEGIQSGNIKSPCVYITPELIADYKKIWSQLVTTNHTPNFHLPFYHLKSDGFWKLKPYPEFENTLLNQYRSITTLDEAIDYGKLDLKLFELLNDSLGRKTFTVVLLETYFPESKERYEDDGSNDYFQKIENELLNESNEQYQSRFEHWDEEEIFVRNGLFKRLVPQSYNHTCCISEMRIIAKGNISMVDACHIVPFSISHNDTITNGIPLCPNLHRAFDRGLITIDSDYKVIISEIFTEDHLNSYGIRQFNGKPIVLPKELNYLPNIENFQWHKKKIFKG